MDKKLIRFKGLDGREYDTPEQLAEADRTYKERMYQPKERFPKKIIEPKLEYKMTEENQEKIPIFGVEPEDPILGRYTAYVRKDKNTEIRPGTLTSRLEAVEMGYFIRNSNGENQYFGDNFTEPMTDLLSKIKGHRYRMLPEKEKVLDVTKDPRFIVHEPLFESEVLWFLRHFEEKSEQPEEDTTLVVSNVKDANPEIPKRKY